MKLKIIKGGKIGGGGGGRKRRLPHRSPHPYNDLLWKATSMIFYRARATSVDDVAQRMTRLSRRVLGHEVNVTKAMATQCIFDCRKRRLGYGWMLLNVEKGTTGFNRGYVPVLVDVDHEDFELWLIQETDVPFVIAGLQSAIHTEATMLENTADGMLFAAAAREADGHTADDLREASDDARYLARRLRRLAQTADTISL